MWNGIQAPLLAVTAHTLTAPKVQLTSTKLLSSQPVQMPEDGRDGVVVGWAWVLHSGVQSLTGPTLIPRGEHNQLFTGTENFAVIFVPWQLDG